MSHTVEWIEPIDNRTYGDILNAENNRNPVVPIGTYNPIDLNRIENNTLYVMEEMLDKMIIKTPPIWTIKTNWDMMEIPSKEDTTRIIRNIKLLMELSNPEIFGELSPIYDSAQISYQLANAMEKNLTTMKNQPALPLVVFFVNIVNGFITETGESSGYFPGDMQLHITAMSQPSKTFIRWSGNADDLQYLEDPYLETTVFETQHHDIMLTAEFEYSIFRTLSILIERHKAGIQGINHSLSYIGEVELYYDAKIRRNYIWFIIYH